MLAAQVNACSSSKNNKDSDFAHILPPAELDLPTKIIRATSRITLSRTGSFTSLEDRDRSVLCEIVRCVSIAKPTQPIKIRRNTIAERLACSLPTIQRALLRLEKLGWIIREEQVKSRRIGFQVGAIALCESAAQSLGLFSTSPAQLDREEAKSASNKTDQKNLRESRVIDAICSSEQSLRQPLPADGLAQERNDEQPNSQESDPAKDAHIAPQAVLIEKDRIPQNLQWLLQHKVTPFGVFKLMKEARMAGALLEDVVTACKEHVQKARKPFAYISTLLQQKKDWKWLAERAVEASNVEQVHQQEVKTTSKLKSELEKIQGRILLDKEKSIAWKIIESLAVGFKYTPETGKIGDGIGSRPFTPGFLAAIDDGRLQFLQA